MPILAVVLCVASGYLMTAVAWQRLKTSPSELVLKLSLSVGFGLGGFSVVLFLVRLLGTTRLVVVDASLLALLLTALLLRRARAAIVSTVKPQIEDFDPPGWLRGVLVAALAIAVLAALYHAVFRSIAHPHGEGWDAFSIWNLHARFLFLGGSHWRDGFNPLIPWSHPDYPLLLPAAIAHFWSYLGHDSPAVPAIIGIVFTFGTLALLVSSLALLRGRYAAMLGGLALSSTPFFVEQGTSQYADVPLSFFILASIVLLHFRHHRPADTGQTLSGTLLLSGLAAAFAAWTKNEGLLFLSSLVAAQVWVFLVRPARDLSIGRSWKPLISFVLGAAPVLLVIACFKHAIATSGDLFSSPQSLVHKVLTPARYGAIIQWFAKEFLRFGSWWLVPGTVAMIAFYFLIPRSRTRSRDAMFRIPVIALGLTLAGYFAIYLITPRDLYWHLRFSLNRLFLQLWPSAVFLFFLFVGRQTPGASQN